MIIQEKKPMISLLDHLIYSTDNKGIKNILLTYYASKAKKKQFEKLPAILLTR